MRLKVQFTLRQILLQLQTHELEQVMCFQNTKVGYALDRHARFKWKNRKKEKERDTKEVQNLTANFIRP